MNIRTSAFLGVAALALGFGGPACVGDDDMARSWRELTYMNFKGAGSGFSQILKRAKPSSPEYIRASLGHALSLQHRQPDVKSDKLRAAAIYDELIPMTEGDPVQALVLLLRARLADQIDYFGDEPERETARGLYTRLIRTWADSPLVHQAAIYRSEVDIFQPDKDTARRGVEEMEAWIARYPDNPLVSLQWQLIGWAYVHPLDDAGKSVEAFLAAEAAGLPAHTKLDSYYWRLANLAEKAGNRKVAVEYYRRLITDVRRPAYGYDAQYRLKQLGVEPPPLPDPFAEDGSETSARKAE